MSEPFIIGQKVYKAEYSQEVYTIQCPDCAGTLKIRAIIADGTEFAIACGGCDPGGYQGPQGFIRQYKTGASAKEYTVTGFTVNAEGYEYQLNNFGGGSYYIGRQDDTFSTKEEAQASCETKRAEIEAEENRKLLAKTKDHKSWAWNLKYHRDCAKEHQRQLDYHLSKMSVCAQHKKED